MPSLEEQLAHAEARFDGFWERMLQAITGAHATVTVLAVTSKIQNFAYENIDFFILTSGFGIFVCALAYLFRDRYVVGEWNLLVQYEQGEVDQSEGYKVHLKNIKNRQISRILMNTAATLLLTHVLVIMAWALDIKFV